MLVPGRCWQSGCLMMTDRLVTLTKVHPITWVHSVLWRPRVPDED